jgi:hypothetical protein
LIAVQCALVALVALLACGLPRASRMELLMEKA